MPILQKAGVYMHYHPSRNEVLILMSSLKFPDQMKEKLAAEDIMICIATEFETVWRLNFSTFNFVPDRKLLSLYLDLKLFCYRYWEQLDNSSDPAKVEAEVNSFTETVIQQIKKFMPTP